MMKLISKFALLILIIAVLYLLISGNLLSRSPLIIAGQLLAIALSIWARRSFQGGNLVFMPNLLTGHCCWQDRISLFDIRCTRSPCSLSGQAFWGICPSSPWLSA